MSDLIRKINERMDELENMMNNNLHISDRFLVVSHIGSLTKLWQALSEEDKDYIQACQWALEERKIWRDNK